MFFVGLTLYQVFERIGYFFIKNPLITNRQYDTPGRIDFPTVLICNKMKLKASKVAQINPSLLRIMSAMYDDNGNPNYDTQLHERLERLEELDFPTAHKKAHQTVEDFIISCRYGRGKSCLDVIQAVSTPNGVCFAVVSNLTVERPGPESTLYMLLNLEVYEIIPGWVSDPGVIISMYDRSVPSSAYSGDGMHIEPGKVVTIPINDIRKLRRHSSGCGRIDLQNFEKNEYSRVACHWEASGSAIEQACGCVPLLSPRHRHLFDSKTVSKTGFELMKYAVFNNGTNTTNITACSLVSEFECVERFTRNRKGDEERMKIPSCPQDCTEVTYSTIVFGNNLDINEMSVFLPADWEEEQTKRLENFKAAFNIIPNRRVPVIRSIQLLAEEAQSFLNQALTAFDVRDNLSTPYIPCTSTDDRYSLIRSIKQLHAKEGLWKHIESYIELVFPFHLRSVFTLLRIDIDSDLSTHSIAEKDNDTSAESPSIFKEIDTAVFDLQLIEASMNRPQSLFGLKWLKSEERKLVVDKILRMVRALLKCISQIRTNITNAKSLRKQCVEIFGKHYKFLKDAHTVSTTLSVNVATAYEDFIKRIVITLRQLKWGDAPRVFHWHNFEIDLKEFQLLYSEGGKDNQKIHDLMKMRNAIRSEITQKISELTSRLEVAIGARFRFFEEIGMPSETNTTIQPIDDSIQCLRRFVPTVDNLKKASFFRTEWTYRLQRQVKIAKSYSPSPQYDEINLLFVKVYFAHFKQELITQERSYSLFLLLAEIGGTIGLYVGAAILTVAETVVFFIETRMARLIMKPITL